MYWEFCAIRTHVNLTFHCFRLFTIFNNTYSAFLRITLKGCKACKDKQVFVKLLTINTDLKMHTNLSVILNNMHIYPELKQLS